MGAQLDLLGKESEKLGLGEARLAHGGRRGRYGYGLSGETKGDR